MYDVFVDSVYGENADKKSSVVRELSGSKVRFAHVSIYIVGCYGQVICIDICIGKKNPPAVIYTPLALCSSQVNNFEIN